VVNIICVCFKVDGIVVIFYMQIFTDF